MLTPTLRKPIEGVPTALAGLGGVIVGGVIAFLGSYYAANREAENVKIMDRRVRLESMIGQIYQAKACFFSDSLSHSLTERVPTTCDPTEAVYKAEATARVYFPELHDDMVKVRMHVAYVMARRINWCGKSGSGMDQGCDEARKASFEDASGLAPLETKLVAELRALQ